MTGIEFLLLFGGLILGVCVGQWIAVVSMRKQDDVICFLGECVCQLSKENTELKAKLDSGEGDEWKYK